jgi:hypothetical protein
MTPTERKTLIAKYKAGYDEVVQSLAGIAPDERDWRPAPGESRSSTTSPTARRSPASGSGGSSSRTRR